MSTPKKQKRKIDPGLESMLAGLPRDWQKHLRVQPPRFVKFDKSTEVYRVSNVQGTVTIGVGIDFEAGRITLHKRGGHRSSYEGDYSFVFKGSDPAVATEVTELMAFATLRASEILARWQVENPKKEVKEK